MTQANTALLSHQKPPLRPVKLGPPDVTVERRNDGAIILRSPHPLRPYPKNLTERLVHWANVAPDRIFLAQRDASGGWRTLTYAQTLASVRAIAAALLQRDLSPERPIAILSGNDIEHALLGLAAMHVGIPYAPISVPYSLMSQDFGKLQIHHRAFSRRAWSSPPMAQPSPARSPPRYRPDVEVVVTTDPPADRKTTPFAALTATTADRGGRRRARAKSGPTRSPNSCSPPARPASPKASSTRSACCAPTRR